ncbi:hypothetical protein DFH28DRAFT_1119896 [Melampsora americana]|nr:hypothetical protein DFH28DRAFT_1119896 [Melampsora americana]
MITSCILIIGAVWSYYCASSSAILVTDPGTHRLLKRNFLVDDEKEAASIIKLPKLKLVVKDPGFQPSQATDGNTIKNEFRHPEGRRVEYEEIMRSSAHLRPGAEWWQPGQLFPGQTFQSVAQGLRDYWYAAWRSPIGRTVKDFVSSGPPKIDRYYFRSNPAELLLLTQKEHYERFSGLVSHTLSDAQRDLSGERTVELIPRFLNILLHGQNYFTSPRAVNLDERYYEQLTETVLDAKTRLLRAEGEDPASEGYPQAINQVIRRMLEGLEGLQQVDPTSDYWNIAKLEDVATKELLDILDPQKMPSGATQEEFHTVIAALDQALGKFNLQVQGQSPPFFVRLDYEKLSTHGKLNRGLLWLSTLPYNENISPASLEAIKSEWRTLTSDIPFAQQLDAFQTKLMDILWNDKTPLSSKIWSSKESILQEIASRTMIFSDELARRIWWRQIRPNRKLLEPFDQITRGHVNRVSSTINRLILMYDPLSSNPRLLRTQPQSPWVQLMERFHSILSSSS